MFFSLGVLKYVVCLCKGCDRCCVFCLYCNAWYIFVYGKHGCFVMQMVYVCGYVHPVAVLIAAFCMTCSWLMLVEDARGDHMEEAYPRAHDSRVGSHECHLLFTPSCGCECFYHL